MAIFEPRALHLHTLESLIADLVSGRAVALEDGTTFSFGSARTRSALQWYRSLGAATWSANVSGPNAEQLVDTILMEPQELPALPARPGNANSRRLTLRKVEAHRFAGLHKFGTPALSPENYIHEFSTPLTLFEGRNGSGKTSLANAIIWALTGEILRPQREPEAATEDFQCWVDASDGGDPTAHRLTAVTPMPDVADFRPNQNWVPADTWVELTFEDESGATLPPIRRSQSRSPQGKLIETPPDLAGLAIDPIAFRIGTVMPGLLPLIRVGSESELGRAVSQLTGLSSLVDLSDHVRRAKQKIDKEFVKAKTVERDKIDASYNTSKNDLEKELQNQPDIAPEIAVPAPSDDNSIEATLGQISEHFETAKATAFQSAQNILGNEFDAGDLRSRNNLENSISPAISEIGQPQRLESLVRLHGLRQLTSEELDSASGRIAEILAEAKTLISLAENPSTAARSRLYARVATWIADHPGPGRSDDHCVVCGGSIIDSIDPVTGRSVKTHLHEAKADAELISQTLAYWVDFTLGDLTRSLPPALQSELGRDLPAHPCDLLRSAIVDELFSHQCFSGVLGKLKDESATAFDTAVFERSEVAEATKIALPMSCGALAQALGRLDLAIRFAKWRQSNDALARVIADQVLGRKPKEGDPQEKVTLTGKLLDLDATVKRAKPLSDALIFCGRLKAQIKLRRAAEDRLKAYNVAGAALANLLSLGILADKQVDQLRKKLSKEAAIWRNRIYLGAFPSTAHELVDTAMGRKGELDLLIRSGGVSAPAQHVTNASALRASLVGFYFAFWEHVLSERGGIKTILLDDPQELLDDENRERLADALGPLIKSGAQIVVTSYDPRFSHYVARTKGVGDVKHFEVHPATKLHPTVRTIFPLTEIIDRKKIFDNDLDAETPARDYADGCRVFLEGKLSDLFEDPAFSSWVKENPVPTLSSFVSRLRQHVNSGPQSMFGAPVLKKFVDHPGLIDNSPTILLMNKSHHGKRQEIRAADVARCASDLDQLVRLAENMYDECCRWRRRDALPPVAVALPDALPPMRIPTLRVVVCPDLAAFTQFSPTGASQDTAEPLDLKLLDGKSAFYLRRNNFGFAAPARSLAIVEADTSTVNDRRLVVARHGGNTYARRFLRSQDSALIGLTAETPDPRTRSPKTIFLPETEVALHQVAGILFEHDITVGAGPEEAVSVDAGKVLERVEVAFRVVDESAIPLALPNQIVLGGRSIALTELGQNEGSLVALSLADGASIFKRVGAALPGALSHLRQFESIGGLGSSQVLSIGKEQFGLLEVQHARLIIGVLYRG